ncbi:MULTISPECIES: hypothetical protein [Bradyrhizobium]|uniref:hypothetical protein n=1 Tax=Bradyrhizobium TaxID=374 RepID=UPI0012BD0F33|nr:MULTISPECIES: hypothetical protein [Bradyrhizobium]
MHVVALSAEKSLGRKYRELSRSPGACSLSPTLLLWKQHCHMSGARSTEAHEARNRGDDLKLKSSDLLPALGLDNDQIVTEGPVIVQMNADRPPVTAWGTSSGHGDLMDQQLRRPTVHQDTGLKDTDLKTRVSAWRCQFDTHCPG